MVESRIINFSTLHLCECRSVLRISHQQLFSRKEEKKKNRSDVMQDLSCLWRFMWDTQFNMLRTIPAPYATLLLYRHYSWYKHWLTCSAALTQPLYDCSGSLYQRHILILISTFYQSCRCHSFHLKVFCCRFSQCVFSGQLRSGICTKY